MKIKVMEYIGRIQDGGAETIVKDYALLLNKDLFDVYVVCRDYNKKSNIYKILKNNNVQIVSMYNDFNIPERFLARLLGSKYVANKIRKVVNTIKPNVIHMHLECLDNFYYARNSLNNIKLLFTCHNLPKKCIGEDRPKENKACNYFLEHNNLQIIALHDEMSKEINKMFNIENTIVIKNGIDFKKFQNVEDTKDNIKKELNIPVDSYVIGQVGRFAYQKNTEFTIMIFKELLKYKQNSHLLLVGRGEQEKALRKLIKELKIENRVSILTNRTDVPKLLKAMDVFMLPSRFEGLGIVLIEAQVSGLPCVVSNNIPQEAFQSKNITSLSLNDDKKKWLEALLNPVGNISNYGNINNYDMSKEIIKIEELYSENGIK